MKIDFSAISAVNLFSAECLLSLYGDTSDLALNISGKH
jgi:hypothetical protein